MSSERSWARRRPIWKRERLAKIKVCLKEVKATEINQKEIKSAAEHHEVPMEEAAVETIGALED
jgi:hypothetical protein